MRLKEPINKTRRTFLKQATLASAAAVSLPRVVLSAGVSLPKPKPVLRRPQSAIDNGKGYTILFQGDSITDGGRSHDLDWNHLMGLGYVYLLCSSLWYRFPQKEFHFINRGVSGNKITDLASRWQADAIDQKPDV